MPAAVSAATPKAAKSTVKQFDYGQVVKKKKANGTEKKKTLNIFQQTQAFIDKGLKKYLLSSKNRTRQVRIKKMPTQYNQDPKNGPWKQTRREMVNGNSEAWYECPVCKKELTS